MDKRQLFLFICVSFGNAEIVDRISVIANGQPIKHSDIIRDIRLTDFLNHAKPAFDLSAQKQAVERLIDQVLIRKELQNGIYAQPEPSDVDALLKQLKQSLGSESAYQRALAAYGIGDQDLRNHLDWQLRVLRFINVRFAPDDQISEADIQAYYRQHLPDFSRAGNSKLDLGSLRPEIKQAISGERVNQQFFAWLDESEKNTSVIYNEEALK